MPLGDRIRELDEQVATAVRRAVEDLREEVRQRLDEATSELQRRLGEVAPDLPESFVTEEHLRRIAEEAAAPTGDALDQARAGAHDDLRAALAEIDRAGSQAGVLEALLGATARHAPRAALLLVRGGRLAGWGARGFESDGQAARSVALDAGDEPWSGLLDGSGPQVLTGARCAPLVSQLESALPREGYAVPLVLRDRLAAVLYADRPGDGDRVDLPALQVLTYAAALSLETLAFRERESTATLAAVEGGAPPALEEPAAGPLPGPEVEELPAAPESEAEAESEAVEPGELEGVTFEEEPAGAEEPSAFREEPSAIGEEPSAFREEPSAFREEPSAFEEEPSAFQEDRPDLAGPSAAEAPDVASAEAEPEPSHTPPHGDELLQPVEAEEPSVEETGELDPTVLEESAFEEAPELGEEARGEEPSAFGEEPAAIGEEPSALEDEPSALEDEPSAPIPWQTESAQTVETEEAPELEGRPEAGDVPPPPPSPQTAGGQVAPPADVEGPGWAFSATREEVSKDQEASHEEARRLARLLVSEIQLYNQDAVEEGRRNRDLYERLKDDIDRSRQLYEERVDPEVRERTDYFYQELVRQLAAGDAKALGI